MGALFHLGQSPHLFFFLNIKHPENRMELSISRAKRRMVIANKIMNAKIKDNLCVCNIALHI